MSVSRLVGLLPFIAFFGTNSLNSHAQSGSLIPDLYGRLNVSEELGRPESGGHDSEFVSNASRLGVAGTIPFSDSVQLIYQAEYDINVANGDFDSDLTSQRNTFVGVRGNFGTLLAGRHDTPTKLLQNRVDLFNDLHGDIRNLVVGENRTNDTLHYASPNFAGFAAAFSAIVDGKSGLRDRLTDSTSASITFNDDNFYAGVSVDNNVNDHDAVRLATQLKLGDLQLGVLYERSRHVSDERGDRDGLVLSAAYTLNQWVLKAQAGASDQRVAGGRQYSVGVDYLINSDSRVFSFITATRSDLRANNNDQYGIGYEYRF